MKTESVTTEPAHLGPAALSALIPGLGQAVRGQAGQAARLFAVGLGLLAVSWWIGSFWQVGWSIFFLMLIVLPWWVLQSYDASLPPPHTSGRLAETLRIVWTHGHDIRYLGGLFFLTAFTDLYIILANPDYALTLFCSKPGGIWGVLAKAQSPTFHTLIGLGFMRLRLWSLLLYMVYAAFGLINASVNYACMGFGRVRTVFLITLLLFTAYVWWRRHCFRAAPAPAKALGA
jgi:hypothetical protein